MDIEELHVSQRPTCDARCVRETIVKPRIKRTVGFDAPQSPSEEEIIAEAKRCLYCYDAPCTKCCPTLVDVKEFVHAAAAGNWYYAAKTILSSNPIPLSTAHICAVEEKCQGGCNLRESINGSIKTNAIQLHSVRKFREFNIKPKVPSANGQKKVAVIGSGPAGLAAAAFLRRFGFGVTIFEAESFAGGLLMNEILPHRLPTEDVQFEIQMVRDAGVEFCFNRKFGSDFTISSLKSDGFDAVFVGIGNPDVIECDFPTKGAETAKDFLRNLNMILKHKKAPISELPNYSRKRILVLGAGDTAMDCASAASRLGGDVTVAFRKDLAGMRAHPAEVWGLMAEGVEFLPLVQPTSIDGNVVRFALQQRKSDGTFHSTGEEIVREYDKVILAFGATIGRSKPLIESKEEGVFYGGDCARSVSVVEAVNDAKTAAKRIAEFLGDNRPVPMFETEVDEVSLKTEFDGLNFPNPLGISSAPVSGTYECIRNCFLAGFGWAVTKTILLTPDVQRENDFRIVRSDDSAYSYVNICMMTEHTCEYWLETITKLKREFPDRVLIASIACSDKEADWVKLTKLVEEAGADGMELNLSCPNEPHGAGSMGDESNKIGMALGQYPDSIKRICSYVRSATKKPFYAKLTPNVTDSTVLAKGAVEGNANGVAMINTVSGISKFYPDGTPLPQVGRDQYVLSGGYSGDAIRPIALKQITAVFQTLPEMPILGIGGIWSGYTALQHIYAGSSVLQVCSGVQKFSYEIAREILSGLQFYLYSWSRPDLRAQLSLGLAEMVALPYMPVLSKETTKDRSIPTIAQLRGIGTKKVVQREAFDPFWTLCAKIDPKKCLQCGKCAYSCRDNSTEAIFRTRENIWKVDPDKCVGCGLCVSVCPVNALKLEVQQKEKKWHFIKEMN